MSLEESVGVDQAKKRQKYASEKGTRTFVCISLPVTVEMEQTVLWAESHQELLQSR